MKVRKIHINLVTLLFFVALVFPGCVSAPQVKPIVTNPLKVEKGSPKKSFWRDQVQYPFAVKYAKARDNKGIEWEVAYMDEYYGSDPAPKVLVLIHGKGAFGGYFGHIMKVALENGLRVIVPDLPHYGKSIPGNLNKPLSRSLQDTRKVIHEIIVKQLRVNKATYLGHSMGGQWVLGYALTYPEAVERIILENPAGLEEYPTKIKAGDKEMLLFDSSQWSMESWKIVWGERLKQGLMQDEEFLRNFFYFKYKNPKTGRVEPAKLGFFINDTEYARYFTEVRVALNYGNKKEHYNYCAADARDIYSLGVEVRREDQNSINKRIQYINVPVFLALGDKDPLLPTPLGGKSNLRWEVIKPFHDDLARAGNPPQVKIYAGAGHFIHTDYPDLFAGDVAGFVLRATVSEPLEDINKYKFPGVKAPEEIQSFFDQFKKDVLTHDMKKISPHYAANFRQDGYNREAFLGILHKTVKYVTNYEIQLTKYEPDKNNHQVVYIDGSVNLGSMIVPFADHSAIIRENGNWKWYGNQR